MTRRTYRGTDVEVSFDGDLCIHATECVRGLEKSPSTTGIGWTGLLAYNAHVARESIDSSGGCPACPQQPWVRLVPCASTRIG